MRTLNFNHLHYFWVVARVGSVTRASRDLHLTQPTLSTQIKQFEREIGAPLFIRTRREMVLTPTGRLVMRYADEMFRSGQDMVEALAGKQSGQTLTIGMNKSVSKLVLRAIIDPLRSMDPPVRFVCTERRREQLLDDLRLQRLDLLVSDAPVCLPGDHAVVGCVLGESPVSFYAAPALAAKCRRGFPGALSGAPFALPLRGTSLREQLQAWFQAHEVRPMVTAEVEDRAMLNYLGQVGLGIIPVAGRIGSEIGRQFGVRCLGPAEGVRDCYYAAALERNLKKPPVAAVFASAGERFGLALSGRTAARRKRGGRGRS